MKTLFAAFFLALSGGVTYGQELYIFTEPASNMSARSIGLRLNNYVMPMPDQNKTGFRLDPEIMVGVNKHLMLHANLYASNMFQNKFRMEGGSLYAKYRFLSRDDIHKHFRMAAFAKGSLIKNPVQMEHTENHLYPDGNGGTVPHEQLFYHLSDELNMDGNHSGMQAGIVATQLKNRLAVSGSASYLRRFNNLNSPKFYDSDVRNALQLTASAGYLLLPKEYTDYKQTNMNLYLELFWQKALDKPGSFIDLAPGVQFIFSSIARLDLGYRFQLGSSLRRFNEQTALVRFEYNFLNVFPKK